MKVVQIFDIGDKVEVTKDLLLYAREADTRILICQGERGHVLEHDFPNTPLIALGERYMPIHIPARYLMLIDGRDEVT